MAAALPVVVSIIGGMVGQAVIGGATGYMIGMGVGAVIGGYLFGPRIGASGTDLGKFQITSPVMGAPLPIIYGRCRVAGNIIWYGDFSAAEAGKGGKGGKGGGQNASVGIAVALGEGILDASTTGLRSIWKGSKKRNLANFSYNYYRGLAVQAVDPYMVANSPVGTEPVHYPHIAYVVLKNLDLGQAPVLPNLTFEVQRTDLSDNTAIPASLLDASIATNGSGDLNPVLVLCDLMTHGRYGFGIDAASIDEDSFLETASWAAAAGLWISLSIDSRKTGLQQVEDILTYFDCLMVYYQGKFRLRRRAQLGEVPFGPFIIYAPTWTAGDYLPDKTYQGTHSGARAVARYGETLYATAYGVNCFDPVWGDYKTGVFLWYSRDGQDWTLCYSDIPTGDPAWPNVGGADSQSLAAGRTDDEQVHLVYSKALYGPGTHAAIYHTAGHAT